MKYSDFTQENSAMLLIDHQVGTMKLIKNLPLSEVEKNTLALAKVAKVLKIPVVLISSQEDRFQGKLMTTLAELLREAYEVRVKRAGIVNAWDDKNFVQAVKDTNRTNLIMAGITTDVCLVFPAISAVREGYNVQAVMDASGSPLKIRRCQNQSCLRYKKAYRPEQEGSLALPQNEFGLDVIAYIGALRYQEHRSVPQIHTHLELKGICIR